MGDFCPFWRVFENLKLSNSVTRQVTFNRTKIGGKCQNWKIQIRHFGWFSTSVALGDFDIKWFIVYVFGGTLFKNSFMVYISLFYKMAKSAKCMIIIKTVLSSLAFLSTQWIDKSFQEVPKCLHLQLGDIQVAACTGGTQFYT